LTVRLVEVYEPEKSRYVYIYIYIYIVESETLNFA
jgi:hypothetical protein